MKIAIKIIIFFSVSLHSTYSQVVTNLGFEQDEERMLYSISDSILDNSYIDSLIQVSNNKVVIGYVSSTHHELIPGIDLEYELNGSVKGKVTTDGRGRFFILTSVAPDAINIKISDNAYYGYDSTIALTERNVHNLAVGLEPKYSIMFRGRVYAGNLPIEGVDVEVKHNEDTFNYTTIGCYVDDENYWNCLYLGMFKTSIPFENPDDTIFINLSKDGFLDKTLQMKLSEYDGTIIPIKLKYSKELSRFPRHNIAIKAGLTFQNSWMVGLQYIGQLSMGKFNRLGLGFETAMLMNTIRSEHSTFNNLPPSKTETLYASGAIGPLVNVSLTNPSNRYLNLYAGIVAPYIFPKQMVAFHPYVAGKMYVDINKAFFWEFRYLYHTLDYAQYIFDAYGNADEQMVEKDFQRLLVSLGIMVSF